MMKILVSGGNGFLAGHIIRELTGRKHEVRVMLRPGAKTPALDGQAFERFEGQLTSAADLRAAVRECDTVIHAAADTSQKHLRLSDYLPVNVDATTKLLQAMRAEGCRRLIYVSTANTIGYGTRENPGDESREMSALFKQSGYARSKQMAEELVLREAAEKTMAVIVVNPSFMIGPLDFNPGSGQIFSMVLNKKVVWCPPGGKNFVDVRDVAFAVANAVRQGKSGNRYLLTGTNMGYRAFFGLVSNLHNQQPAFVPVPSFALKLAGCIGSICRKLHIKTALSITNTRILCIGNYYSNTKACDELGFNPTKPEKTISDYSDWKQSNSFVS
jgi:dihydroflavonol-4-reductase